jgi:hypothetical protein
MRADPTVGAIHLTDSSCPWAYSTEPFLRALAWRFVEVWFPA